MPIKTKTLTFKKNSITFLEYSSMGWCVPAKLIGAALGYANAGQKLNDLVTHSWSKKNWGPEDSKVFTGKELEELKKGTPEYGVSLEASSVLFLSMSGVIKVLMRSRSKTADEFRSFISSKGGELTEGVQMPKKVLTKSVKKAQQIVASNDIPAHMRARLALLGELKKYNFSEEHIQKLLMELYTEETNRQNTAAAFNAIGAMMAPVTKKDSTSLVPVSNIQASSLTPNFDSIRSFFLTGHQKHPKHLDWISAEEIGETCGKTADQVKTFSTKYAESLGYKLPNVQLMEEVKKQGGYFKGVSTLVDGDFLPSLCNPILGAVAVWYLTEDGKMLWRNYWAPDAVTKIRALMGLGPISSPQAFAQPVGNQAQFPPQTSALAPVNHQA